MKNDARVRLPCKSWRCGVPEAVVRPMIHREGLDHSEGGAPSAGSPTASPNLLAAWGGSTDGQLSATDGAAWLRGRIAPDQDSGDGRGEVIAPWRPRVTVPRTPTVLKRHSAVWRPMSSEEREMATISRLQKETAEHRKRNEAMMRLAIAGTGQPMERITIPLRPTNNRVKDLSESGSEPEYKEWHFINELRTYPPSTHLITGCTVPKPFNLSSCKKRECEDAAGGPYISMAEYIDMFEHRTQPGGRKRPRHQEIPDQHGALWLTGCGDSRDPVICRVSLSPDQ
ncbi:targeting protein for Xklp2-like [Heptranchias perlo]|uniref:targeting protein for Xklp2-like n=1 Tax=Heptranchias perlo TaxID=212740 RepID=UPI0035596E6A